MTSSPVRPMPARRRLPALALAALTVLACLLCGSTRAQAVTLNLNLETLSGTEAEQMLQNGEVTSVELVEAYMARIAALSKAGPGLNAVTQYNPEAIAEAEKADRERTEGKDLGPAMGLPILLKDIIDATPMYTSAGDWALRQSFPERDSGVAKQLRAHGVVILGKTGLSEWANSFGSQPSGFSNLTGQVLNANDTAQGPSGSSSGSGAAGAAALAALTIGTETSGSIISPSREQGLVGLRPTVGLVPGYGIAPISASQDTAGPMERTVADVAITLDSIAEVPGTDPEANEEYEGMMGPNFHTNGDIPLAPFSTLPDYTSALTTAYVQGKRIGYNGNTCTGVGCTPTPSQEAVQKAKETLEAAGAILVPDEQTTVDPTIPALPSGYEQHATIDAYYKHLGPKVPVKSLVEEVAVDESNPQEALKDGNSTHRRSSESESAPGGPNQQEYEAKLPIRKAAFHAAIEKMMNEPSGGGGPVIAVIGSVPSGPQAGYPQVTVPMGYSPAQRRALAVSVNGGAYDELDLIGVSYVIEQATHLRRTPAEVNPAAYRCAHTAVPAPFAARGDCNPDYESLMAMLGGTPKVLPFALENASAQELQAKMEAGSLSAEELVKAELYRAALTNAKGPSVQAIRKIAPDAIQQAMASDARRAAGTLRGPLDGIPVLVDDSIDAAGLPTSGGSIALQENVASADSTLVAKLRAKGAVILGDTNTGELGGTMAEATGMPQGYSSLGGQVLLPSDTNKSPGGSSAGSAAAVSVGLAPLSVGLETSTEAAQMIVPAANSGLVGLKPTVGLVSRSGVMPVAKSQDSPGAMAQTVRDVANSLNVLAGPDPLDPATAGQPATLPDYAAKLSKAALNGKKIAVLPTPATEAEEKAESGYLTTKAAYLAAISQVNGLGGTTVSVTPGAAPSTASVIPYELHRDLDAYLSAGTGGAGSLQQVIAYNLANPVEGLKFGQAKLTAAQAVEPNDAATKTTYEANLSGGRTEARAVIDNMLTGGYSAIMVPVGSARGNSLIGIADRAGYPVLTVPAGFVPLNNNTGGDPVGIALIGTSYSEPELLVDGYSLEQGLDARETGPGYMRTPINAAFLSGAPSQTNQSMFRCVFGSAFYKPYDCNPGEVAAVSSEAPSEGGGSPGGGGGGGEGGGGGGGAGGAGAGGAANPPAGKLGLGKVKLLTGSGSAVISVEVPGGGKVLLSGPAVKAVKKAVSGPGTIWMTVKPKGKALKALAKQGHAKVKVEIEFVGGDGSKTTKSRTVLLVEK